jgi:hypothetical protein
MTAPNYDQGSCYIYEGWRFGSVRKKTRRLRRWIKPDSWEASEQWRRARSEREKAPICSRIEVLLGGIWAMKARFLGV